MAEYTDARAAELSAQVDKLLDQIAEERAARAVLAADLARTTGERDAAVARAEAAEAALSAVTAERNTAQDRAAGMAQCLDRVRREADDVLTEELRRFIRGVLAGAG